MTVGFPVFPSVLSALASHTLKLHHYGIHTYIVTSSSSSDSFYYNIFFFRSGDAFYLEIYFSGIAVNTRAVLPHARGVYLLPSVSIRLSVTLHVKSAPGERVDGRGVCVHLRTPCLSAECGMH